MSHLIECVTKVFVEKDSAVGRNPGSNVNQTEKSGQRQRSKRNRQVAEKSIAGISSNYFFEPTKCNHTNLRNY